MNQLIRKSKKGIKLVMRLNIPPQSATSGPPIGPLLGQHGIVSTPFCKEFNEFTTIFRKKAILRTLFILRKTGAFSFSIRIPSMSWFLKVALRIRKCCTHPDFKVIVLRRDRDRLLKSSLLPILVLYEIFLYINSYTQRLQAVSIFRMLLGVVQSSGLQVVSAAGDYF